jgi:hypothetical protein
MPNPTNLIGKKSGTLIAKEYLGNSKWKCICKKCNNEVIITTNWFNKNIKLKRDGCKHVNYNLIGEKFGYLTVIKQAEDYIKPRSKAHERQWLCKCICGRTKVIIESNLKGSKSISCGICMSHISIPEKMIYYYLSKCFNDIKEQYRPKFLKGREIDIYIPELKLGIEYDGKNWHKDTNKDILKNKLCEENGITLIRVREPECPKISGIKYCIITPKTTSNGTHMTIPIKNIINIINKDYNHDIKIDVNCLRDNADICKRILSTVGFNSLEYLYPEIAKEWDYEKNYPLTPDKVFAHTGKKAWWICPKGHSYSSVIASRTGNDKCECPKCKKDKYYKKVRCIELNKVFNSVQVAAQFVNRKPCRITSVCKKYRGYDETCGGYHWEYIDN